MKEIKNSDKEETDNQRAMNTVFKTRAMWIIFLNQFTFFGEILLKISV